MTKTQEAGSVLDERVKERHVLLMHPLSAVVHGLGHFFPFGENTLHEVSKQSRLHHKAKGT